MNEETYHVHGLEDNLAKMSILSNLINRFNTISIKIPTKSTFCIYNKIILKFKWKDKGIMTAKIILKKKNKVGGSNYFKTYSQPQ